MIKNFNIRLGYNYSALVGMSISTEEFQSLPTRSYLVRGRKIKIPDNAKPRADGSLKFDGNFNGLLSNDTFLPHALFVYSMTCLRTKGTALVILLTKQI